MCIDLLRRNQRTRQAISLEDADDIGCAPGLDADARRAVIQSLERLGEREQAVAIGVFIDGLTQSEVADELGLSRVTINKDVQKIRAHLSHDFPQNPISEEASS